MQVKGSVYSPGDLIPNGERLKATLYQCTRYGVMSDDVDSDMLDCRERELYCQSNTYFPIPAAIQSGPSYLAQSWRQREYVGNQGDDGARIGRWIKIVGFHVAIRIVDESETGTSMIESPPGTFLGNTTPPACDFFRFCIIVECTSTAATTDCRGAFFGSGFTPEVFESIDCTSRDKYVCLFDRMIPITPPTAVIEQYFIDCDFLVEIPDGAFMAPTKNKIWFVYWANIRSVSTRRTFDIHSKIYYYN